MAMAISLDRICSLDANKTYYLANSTGEIKEATLWQKFKCKTGLGDGRAKVVRLAEAIKASLLDSAGQLNNETLNVSMRADLEKAFSELQWFVVNVSGSARTAGLLVLRQIQCMPFLTYRCGKKSD